MLGKRIWIPAASLVVGILAGALLYLPLQAAMEAENEDSVYVLREYEGRVAIYSGGSGAPPDTVTDIEVQLLPVWDRQQLHQGIGVDDPQELSRLLEDLGS